RGDPDRRHLRLVRGLATAALHPASSHPWEIPQVQARRLSDRRRRPMKRSVHVAVSLALGITLLAPAAFAQSAQSADSSADRKAAALRYLKVSRTQSLMNDMIEIISKQVPEDRREECIALMRRLIDNERLESQVVDALARHYTLAELQAMEKFYGSPEGRSIQTKLTGYLTEVMAIFQTEVMRILATARGEEEL